MTTKPARTATKSDTPTKSVADRLAELPVRYAMRVGKISIIPKTKKVVQLKNGEYDRVETLGLKLESEGPRNMNGMTREFDPMHEGDAAIIRAVDEFITSGVPAVADSHLRKVTVADAYVPPPISDWYEKKPAKLLEVMKVADLNLEQCLKFELQNPNEGGPRVEVLGSIEALQKQRSVEREDAAKRADVEADVEF